MRRLCLLLPALLLATPAAAEETGRFYAECAPMGNVADSVGGMMAPVLGQAPELLDEPFVNGLMSLASRDLLEAGGFDAEGAVRMHLIGDDDPEVVIEVDFAGDDTAAEAFLTLLAPDESFTRLPQGAWTWSMDDEPFEAALEDGVLRLGAPGVALQRASLEELPAEWRTGGCGITMRPPKGEDAPKGLANIGTLRLFVPMPDPTAELATFRLQMDAPDVLPPYVATTSDWVAMGTSKEPPVLVGSFGAPLLEVLGTKPLSELIPLPVLDLDQLREAIVIEPGATIALLNSPLVAQQTGEPIEFVVALRAKTVKGQPLKPLHLARALKEVVKADPSWALNRISGKAYELTRGEEQYGFHLTRDALYLGTNLAATASAALGEGEPWAPAAHTDTAADWSVTISANNLLSVFPLPGDGEWPAILRLRTVEGMLEAELSLVGPGAVQFALGTTAAMAISNFIQMQKRAKRTELPTNVDAIRTFQKAHWAEHDTYVALPPAPRGLDALDGDGIDWVSTPEWEAFGWSPDGQVRGVYWVEVSEDGQSFTVYGTADLDGDGIPCRYQATDSQGAEALTPPGVF
ncbi:MAG: hypothetical protein GY898_17045 [Proteobacteria bacterium]|nr:hypothetical protein [Pseudomonadota bacterium]